MGLPALSIPDNMVGELPTILSNNGITVGKLPVSEKDARLGLIMVLTCSLNPQAVVRVRVQRNWKKGGSFIIILPSLL
jgi:hypothetical protein